MRSRTYQLSGTKEILDGLEYLFDILNRAVELDRDTVIEFYFSVGDPFQQLIARRMDSSSTKKLGDVSFAQSLGVPKVLLEKSEERMVQPLESEETFKATKSLKITGYGETSKKIYRFTIDV